MSSITKDIAFQYLDFGKVDAESESDLDSKFLKTNDFEKFIDPQNMLIIGAKGSGKSAFFNLFTKYEASARKMAEGKLKNVVLVEATGFQDETEINTEVITEFKEGKSFDFAHLWKLYIAIKLAKKLISQIETKGEASLLLKTIGQKKDFRILPLLRQFWQGIVGPIPKTIKIPFIGEIKIGTSVATFKPADILYDINKSLQEKDLVAWLIFDKIDEIYPMSITDRNNALSSLIRTAMELQDKYSNIRFKIFIRSDIWPHLSFVNKTHLDDKKIKLEWTEDSLCALLIKRALVNKNVKEYIENQLEERIDFSKDELSYDIAKKVFYLIFDNQIYSGPKEARSLGWMIERITDGLDSKFPREMIMFANKAKEHQKVLSNKQHMIDGLNIKNSYEDISIARCENYLAEFPIYKKYFDTFTGANQTTFTYEELKKLFDGLALDFDEVLNELTDSIGLLKKNITKNTYEVPRLYRIGLKMVLKGRP